MRVLVACEFSGIVRDAFRAKGHDAWSCDILPTERDGPHIQGDALAILGNGWDLLIAHPPCTFLANSGARWLFEAVENPMPHKWATARIGRRYDFKVQPWEHGARQKKTTCFWTRQLPPLLPTVVVGPPPASGTDEAKAWESTWREAPGPLQAHNRSRTYQGIADAMAGQWGCL